MSIDTLSCRSLTFHPSKRFQDGLDQCPVLFVIASSSPRTDLCLDSVAEHGVFAFRLTQIESVQKISELRDRANQCASPSLRVEVILDVGRDLVFGGCSERHHNRRAGCGLKALEQVLRLLSGSRCDRDLAGEGLLSFLKEQVDSSAALDRGLKACAIALALRIALEEGLEVSVLRATTTWEMAWRKWVWLRGPNRLAGGRLFLWVGRG